MWPFSKCEPRHAKTGLQILVIVILKKKLGWHLPSQDLFWYITDYKIELSYLQRLYLGGFHVTGQVTGQTIPINNVDRDVMIIFFRALCCSERFEGLFFHDMFHVFVVQFVQRYSYLASSSFESGG